MASAVPPGGLASPAEPRPATGDGQPESRSVGTPRSLRRLPARRAVVRVVVVNFCQWRNTARLVQQLRRSAACRTGLAEIVVVDNNSPFHPSVRRLEATPGVVVRRLHRNHGFARAVNLGANLPFPPREWHRQSRERKRPRHAPDPEPSDWILLLNPDVTVGNGFLDGVVAAAERLAVSEPELGVVGFGMRNRDGSAQASSGPFPSLFRTLAGLLLPRSRRKCIHRREPYRQTVDWVTGGCLLVRRECFRQLGGLDDGFFLYYEDVDFCRRAAAAGWTVCYDPSLEVTHHWPLHARRVPAPLRLITRHALLRYARKHWSHGQFVLTSALVWAEAAVRQLWACVHGSTDASRCYGQLRQLVADLADGRDQAVARRVAYAAAFLYPISAEQDDRTR